MGCRVGGGMADAADLKSAGVKPRVGSNPTRPTFFFSYFAVYWGMNVLESCGSTCGRAPVIQRKSCFLGMSAGWHSRIANFFTSKWGGPAKVQVRPRFWTGTVEFWQSSKCVSKAPEI